MFSKKFVAILITILAISVGRAEVLFYTGQLKAKSLTGLGHQTSRAFLIYDIESGATTQITYYTQDKSVAGVPVKIYGVTELEGFVKQTVSLISESNTIFSRLRFATNESSTSYETTLMKGKNATLKTSATSTYSFPRRFNLQAQRIETLLANPTQARVQDVTGTFVFYGHDTLAMNNAGETYTQTIERLIQYLVSRGYFPGSD